MWHNPVGCYILTLFKIIPVKNPIWSWQLQSIMDRVLNEPRMTNPFTPLPRINTVPQYPASNNNSGTRKILECQTQLTNLQEAICMCSTTD